MIGRMISNLRPPRPTGAGEVVPEEAILAAPPDGATRFPPMAPLTPPPAINDDLDVALCDAVEAALRAAGYLPDPPAA